MAVAPIEEGTPRVALYVVTEDRRGHRDQQELRRGHILEVHLLIDARNVYSRKVSFSSRLGALGSLSRCCAQKLTQEQQHRGCFVFRARPLYVCLQSVGQIDGFG